MGTAYPVICDKCGYNFRASFGVGFLFPSVYAEVTAAAKSGELGAELKNFFAEHPDGAIDVSNIFGVCKQCGKFENVADLSMYLPADDFSPAERSLVCSISLYRSRICFAEGFEGTLQAFRQVSSQVQALRRRNGNF